MAYMQDVNRPLLNREENPIYVRGVAIEQLAYFEREAEFSGARAQRVGNSASEAIASCSAKNQSIAASPACSDSSQSRIASASCSAPAVVSTRKVMLAA
jgi:hypothetical protein